VHQIDAGRQPCRGQQQRRDELAGGARIDLHPRPAQLSGGIHGEGQRVVVQLNTELGQTVQQRAHRTLRRVRITEEVAAATRQCRDWRHEAHHGAGQTAVDALGTRREMRWRRHPDDVFGGIQRDVDPNPQGAQRSDHQLGIAGCQQTDQRARRVGQRGQHQRAI